MRRRLRGVPPLHRRSTPSRRAPGRSSGRVGLERRTVQITDARADPAVSVAQGARARRLPHDARRADARGRPRRRGDRALALAGRPVRRADDRARDDVRRPGRRSRSGTCELFQELEQRSEQLARSVDELRALGEVSQAVSSSLDLDEVLTTIVTRAAELSGADGGSIFEFEPSTAEFVLRTCAGTSEELVRRAARDPDRARRDVHGPARPPRARCGRRRISTSSRPIRTSTRSAATGGARWWRCRSGARTRSSAR